MAIDAASVTANQFANMSNDPLVQTIYNSTYQLDTPVSDLMLNMITKPLLKVNAVRWTTNLPSVNWRKLNASTVVTSGTPSPITENAYIMSNAIDCDIKYLQDQSQIVNPLSAQAQGHLEGAIYDLSDKFINNDPITGNADAPVGIRTRLDNPTLYAAFSGLKVDAGGVDLSAAGLTAATANTILRYMDAQLSLMGAPNGDGVCIYMNYQLQAAINAAIRLLGSGGFRNVVDGFDRTITKYRNATIRTVGVKADQTTQIITSTETAAGANGSSNYTSMYFVKYGDGWFQPWQFSPMMYQVIGQRSDEPTISRIFFDWALGYIQYHPRAIGRIFDIKVQ